MPGRVGGQQVQPAPATGLAALGLLDPALHAFAEALQRVVAAGVSTALPSPAPVWPDIKGCDTVPTAPPLCMWDGSGCGLPSHYGVGRLGKSQDRGACHPESGPDESPVILLPEIRRQGEFKRLPPTAHVCEKREPAETIPQPRVHRGGRGGGVHSLDDAPSTS